MMKVCLVGVGGISGAHIPAWEKMEDVQLVALCDKRPEQLKKYPKMHHYTDLDQMLPTEKPDILDICLPTYLHTEAALKAMNMGIHVLCEKPISLHKEDVALLYGAAERNGVRFMVAQVLRFWPEYDLLKQIYDSGKYGKLISGSMTRLGQYPASSCGGWMMDPQRSGMVPFDLHIHDLDFMVYAFGKPNDFSNFRAQRPDQDYLCRVYHYDDFFIVSEASWYASPYPFAMKFRFQFEDAIVAMEGALTIYERSGKVFKPKEDSIEGLELFSGGGYANEIRYFVDCVKNGTFPAKVDPHQLETVIELLQS